MKYNTKEIKEINEIMAGLLLAFGFPAVAWAFAGWKWALLTFVVLQFILVLIKLSASKED